MDNFIIATSEACPSINGAYVLTYDLYKELDIATAIKQGRIRWAGHVQRMTEERAVEKVFVGGPGGRRARGRQRRRWVDDIDEDLKDWRSEGGEESHRCV